MSLTYNDQISDEIEYAVENSASLEIFLQELHFYDLSKTPISPTLYYNMLMSNNNYSIITNVNDRIRILETMVEEGFDFNEYPTNFNYGQSMVRSGEVKLIEFILDNGFKFNSYTKENWHSLRLIHFNYFGNDQKPIRDIIKKELDKGIDLSKENPDDFLSQLSRNSNNLGWDELIDLYLKYDFMVEFFNDNVEIVVREKMFDLVFNEVRDIFLF